VTEDLDVFINMDESPIETRCPRPDEVPADISSTEDATGMQFQLKCCATLVKWRRTAELFEWLEGQAKQSVDNCGRNSF